MFLLHSDIVFVEMKAFQLLIVSCKHDFLKSISFSHCNSFSFYTFFFHFYYDLLNYIKKDEFIFFLRKSFEADRRNYILKI